MQARTLPLNYTVPTVVFLPLVLALLFLVKRELLVPREHPPPTRSDPSAQPSQRTGALPAPLPSPLPQMMCLSSYVDRSSHPSRKSCCGPRPFLCLPLSSFFCILLIYLL